MGTGTLIWVRMDAEMEAAVKKVEDHARANLLPGMKLSKTGLFRSIVLMGLERFDELVAEQAKKGS